MSKTLAFQVQEFEHAMQGVGVDTTGQSVRLHRLFGSQSSHFYDMLSDLAQYDEINTDLHSVTVRDLDTCSEQDKVHVQSIRAIYGSLSVNISSSDYTLTGNDFFVAPKKDREAGVMKRVFDFRYCTNPQFDCLLCGEPPPHAHHTCDFFAGANAHYDSGCRLVCVAVVHRFFCTSPQNTKTPSIELSFIRPYSVLSSMMTVVEFACALVPGIGDKMAPDLFDISALQKGSARVPVCIFGTQRAVDVCLTVIRENYSLNQDALDCMKCLMTNVGYAVMLLTRNKTRVFMPMSNTKCASPDNLRLKTCPPRNTKLSVLLHELKHCLVDMMFVSTTEPSAETIKTNRALFMSCMREVCNNVGVLTIVQNATTSTDTVQHAADSKLYDMRMDMNDACIRQFLDFLYAVRGLWGCKQDVYFKKIFHVHDKPMPNVAQSMHYQLNFLWHCFNKMYDAGVISVSPHALTDATSITVWTRSLK